MRSSSSASSARLIRAAARRRRRSARGRARAAQPRGGRGRRCAPRARPASARTAAPSPGARRRAPRSASSSSFGVFGCRGEALSELGLRLDELRARAQVSSRSRRLSSCARAASPTCAWASASSAPGGIRPTPPRLTLARASASSRSFFSTCRDALGSSLRSRPSSSSAAMRIARSRSSSASMDAGSTASRRPKRGTRR